LFINSFNWRDIAVKDEEGNPIYPVGVSVAFDHMLDKCIAIVVPKSGLSAEVDWVGNITYSRDWWMSESTPRTIEVGELPLPRKERGTAIPNPLKLIGVPS
jgi:hypothetical protein